MLFICVYHRFIPLSLDFLFLPSPTLLASRLTQVRLPIGLTFGGYCYRLTTRISSVRARSVHAARVRFLRANKAVNMILNHRAWSEHNWISTTATNVMCVWVRERLEAFMHEENTNAQWITINARIIDTFRNLHRRHEIGDGGWVVRAIGNSPISSFTAHIYWIK